MTILSTGEKSLYIKQGDTGNLYFRGLPKDKAYDVYFSIYDPDNYTIIKETQANVFAQAAGEAYFAIDEDFSNALPVGDWVYGLKICFNGSEDTILPRAYIDEDGNLVKENAPEIHIDNKYVEGA